MSQIWRHIPILWAADTPPAPPVVASFTTTPRSSCQGSIFFGVTDQCYPAHYAGCCTGCLFWTHLARNKDTHGATWTHQFHKVVHLLSMWSDLETWASAETVIHFGEQPTNSQWSAVYLQAIDQRLQTQEPSLPVRIVHKQCKFYSILHILQRGKYSASARSHVHTTRLLVGLHVEVQDHPDFIFFTLLSLPTW